MATRTLTIYINDQFYKQVVVESQDGVQYQPGPVIQQILNDKDAGLLDQFNLEPGTLPIRIELREHGN